MSACRARSAPKRCTRIVGASWFRGRQRPQDRQISCLRRHPAGRKKDPLQVRKMPIPKASRALNRFTVLDLTQVRSGPTCVRQLADWGANVIKIEQPPELTTGEPPGGPREGPDFQNLHRNKRAITLNLKSPEGLAAFMRHGEEGRRGGRELPARREEAPEDRLQGPQEGQPEDHPRQHFGVRPGRALCRTAGLRPDRAGHGRPDVGHRTARAGAGARRHPDRRPLRRAVLRHGHHGRAARAREVRQRPARRDLAAAGADLHARLPGLALAGEGRGRRSGRQQSSDLDADRRLQDRRRPHQHRLDRPEDLGAAGQGARRAGDAARTPTTPPPRRDRSTATSSTRRSTATPSSAPARIGSSCSTRPACRPGRSIPSTRCSPTRRSSTSRWIRP